MFSKYKPLSDVDLKQINPKVSVLSTQDLQRYTNINQLPNPSIIFYGSGGDIGHWTLFFKNKEGLNFFDPYGKSQGKFLVPDTQRIWGNGFEDNPPILSQLFLNSGRDDMFGNEIKYQSEDNRIATCGAHAIIRSIFKDLSEKEYFELINKLKKVYNTNSSDDVVINLLNLK